MRTSSRLFGTGVSAVPAVGGTVLALLLGPARVLAQATPTDSAKVLRDAHEVQRKFERFRESHTPVHQEEDAGRCDQLIGRFCIWYGGEDEERFPAELKEVKEAREGLIQTLSGAFEEIKDSWLLGQLVHYLAEQREMQEAERVARACGIQETWWCSALLGYALHLRNQYVDAEAAFREALDAMPEAEREKWITPRYIFDSDAQQTFMSLPPAERERQWELFWRLSDPLYLFQGNDRLTDHYARWVEDRIRENAASPMGPPLAVAPNSGETTAEADSVEASEWSDWGGDLEETLIRYGRNIGYSRTQDPSRVFSGGVVQDTRRMVAHHDPKSRGYLFPVEFLKSPSDIPPESWITAPRESRTWYAPPYAPDMRELETQVGRFRRDDQMLVVGAYRPTVPSPDAPGGVASATESTGGMQSVPYAALFLIPEDGGRRVSTQNREPAGVLTVQAWPGRYVSSLEVADVDGRRAWRARQGVVQPPLAPGDVDVSDLMILKEGTPLPESLDEALPYIRPGVRMKQGERFPVIWEVYGLGVLEPVRVTIGFTRGRPGFLQRVGQFLGVIEPERPVEISFDETGPEQVQTVFRSMELTLPDLDPGEYTLHLRLELEGREPAVASRPIVLER